MSNLAVIDRKYKLVCDLNDYSLVKHSFLRLSISFPVKMDPYMSLSILNRLIN